jgi:hypothetical protein
MFEGLLALPDYPLNKNPESCLQVYSYYEMNHSTENPFVLIYAVALVLWALTFCQLWISLENSRKVCPKFRSPNLEPQRNTEHGALMTQL